MIQLFKFQKLPMLLVELFSRTWELWKQQFSIVNINMVEGTKNNIKAMVVNIDKI